MKAAIIATVFALALAACQLPPSVTTAISGINTTVATIQSAVVAGCKFQPTEATIEAIIGKLIPGLDTIQSIANEICAAVSPAGQTAARRARSVPMVNGVPIRGRFVSH